MYKEIKSKYIRDEIKRTKWKNRNYIDDLIRIEWLAQGKTFGFGTGFAMKKLPELYPVEWKAIWMEINPKQYECNNKCEKRWKRAEKAEEREWKKALDKQRKQERKEWKNLGGKD